MGKSALLLIIGIILIFLGFSNFKGNISSIHWYNRRNVSENDVPKYGRCMGSGGMIIGFSLIISALLELIFSSSVFDYIILFGCAIGVIVMLYGQFKYNKGIF